MIKITTCDKCHKEIPMNKAIVRYPLFLDELFRFCPTCAAIFDKIEAEIDAEADQIKEKAFREFIREE